MFRKELTWWLIISLSGFGFLKSFKKFDLHNLIEAIEFKDESADILSGLEAEIDPLIFLLILLLKISSCVRVYNLYLLEENDCLLVVNKNCLKNV